MKTIEIQDPDYVGYSITPIKPNHSISFHSTQDNGFIAQEIGRLDFNGPCLVFEGNAEESALVFIDYVAKHFEERLKQEYQRGYEDCLSAEASKG